MFTKNQRKISYLYTSNFEKVPLIRLSGKWLISAGFDIGKTYEIKVGKNSLILTAKN